MFFSNRIKAIAVQFGFNGSVEWFHLITENDIEKMKKGVNAAPPI